MGSFADKSSNSNASEPVLLMQICLPSGEKEDLKDSCLLTSSSRANRIACKLHSPFISNETDSLYARLASSPPSRQEVQISNCGSVAGETSCNSGPPNGSKSTGFKS